MSSCLRQVPPPCQPSSLGGGCSNDSDYDDADDNVAGDDDDDDEDEDDDDHEEEEAELALGQRWDWLQFADFVLNVAQVDRGQGGRTGRLRHETHFRFHVLKSSYRASSYRRSENRPGLLWGSHGGPLGPSWAVVRPLGPSWGSLGPSWGPLRRPEGLLGPFWGSREAVLGLSGRHRGPV